MNNQIITTAEVVCNLYNSGVSNIDEVINRNKGVYIDLDGADRWIFEDSSIFIIDGEDKGSFIKVEEEKKQPESKQPWYKRFIKEKKTVSLVIAGGLIAAASGAVGALYFHKS